MPITTSRIGLSALAIMTMACAPRPGMVRIPRADATPPRAALLVAGTTQDVGPEGVADLKLSAEDEPQSVSLLESDSLVLTAIAEDGDGGVKKSALEGNAFVTCEDSETGKITSKSTAFGRWHVPGSPRASSARSRRVESFVLRGSDFARLCPGGRLQGAFGQASATASNFHGGGSSSARLRFKVSLSEVAANAIPYPNRPGKGRPAPAIPGLASSGTGFTPLGGKGGSGGRTASGNPVTDFKNIPAAPASVASPACIDPPVPFMSPRRGEVSPAGPASRAFSPQRPRSTQTSQIPRFGAHSA